MERVASLDSLRNLCRPAGQEHLLAHWDRLTEPQQKQLASQIDSVDFGLVTGLAAGEGFASEAAEIANRAEPPEAVPLGSHYRGFSPQDALEEGNRIIAAGKVAMILVAGGQGTRLGFDQPKGMFPIGPVSGRTLFEMHVDSLKGAMKRFGVSIPLLIMTSPATDALTRKYFEENDRLGLREDELILFQQGTMPAIDAATGRILMDSPFELALSPDGHGGIVSALVKSGVMETMRSRGIEVLFYAQVDNPLVRACDPILIGYHRLAESQMTTQVVRKRFAKERVGNVVQIDGRTHIIEYSDLPDALAEQTLPDGSLKLWAGNIAVHVFDRAFLEQAACDAEALPFHRALKSVPYVDSEGNRHKPATPNAVKMERFVFDLLPRARRTLVVEGDAAEVFAPVKNAEGSATDTPTTSRQAISKLHGTWLEQAGWKVEEGVQVEIHPLWAWDAVEVRDKIQGQGVVLADTYFT
ncbi:MAG: UDPGP type 1 family protein [Pirellula sp.]|jgi:UDP-N-acetylglucosamine/UDP-N-acetylgalactosamine diphosphorylase|nr:UDPGP type 1 family protein [Pirellula sp.]